MINSELESKVLTVRINDRDINGKIIWNKFVNIKGKCIFAGYNEVLGCDQVTINRTPIYPVTIDDIVKVE